jgi:hypothetical protein
MWIVPYFICLWTWAGHLTNLESQIYQLSNFQFNKRRIQLQLNCQPSQLTAYIHLYTVRTFLKFRELLFCAEGWVFFPLFCSKWKWIHKNLLRADIRAQPSLRSSYCFKSAHRKHDYFISYCTCVCYAFIQPSWNPVTKCPELRIEISYLWIRKLYGFR